MYQKMKQAKRNSVDLSASLLIQGSDGGPLGLQGRVVPLLVPAEIGQDRNRVVDGNWMLAGRHASLYI